MITLSSPQWRAILGMRLDPEKLIARASVDAFVRMHEAGADGRSRNEYVQRMSQRWEREFPAIGGADSGGEYFSGASLNSAVYRCIREQKFDKKEAVVLACGLQGTTGLR